jgi:ribosomal protein L10
MEAEMDKLIKEKEKNVQIVRKTGLRSNKMKQMRKQNTEDTQ